eukprot:1078461-Pyramimonas_sp.AAC.1
MDKLGMLVFTIPRDGGRLYFSATDAIKITGIKKERTAGTYIRKHFPLWKKPLAKHQIGGLLKSCPRSKGELSLDTFGA